MATTTTYPQPPYYRATLQNLPRKESSSVASAAAQSLRRQLDLSAPGFDFSALPALQLACSSVLSMFSSPFLSIVSIPFHLPVLWFQRFSVLRASRRFLSSRFVWPGLARDVGLWSRSCLRCQQSKIQTHVRSSVPSIPVPGKRFFHVHLVGPLRSSQGFSYILTMKDRRGLPLSSITAKACARAFISTWVSRFGVPALLTSDRGAQFTSSVWSEVCSVLGVSRIQTTSSHS